MHIFPEYFQADKRLMILGKETNSWGGHLKDYPSLDKVLQCYQDFKLSMVTACRRVKKYHICSTHHF
jgi:hypothetical protein